MRLKAESLEEESAHWDPFGRNMLCPAEARSWAIAQCLRRDLQFDSERHRQFTQCDQSGCSADAEAIPDYGRALGRDQSGPRVCRELDQYLSRSDESGVQYALHERRDSRTSTVRKRPAQPAVIADSGP